MGKSVLIKIVMSGYYAKYSITVGILRKLMLICVCNITFWAIIKFGLVLDSNCPSTVQFLIGTRKKVGCTVINMDMNAPFGVTNVILQLASGLVISAIVILVPRFEVISSKFRVPKVTGLIAALDETFSDLSVLEVWLL